jgi:hypothetical protein
MHAFVRTQPHLSTMANLDDWCDETTFADWEQASEDVNGSAGLAGELPPPSEPVRRRVSSNGRCGR